VTITYKKSGVDIDTANAFVEWIKTKVPSIGFFSGFYPLPDGHMLVSTTDGVGTKVKLAQLVGRHDTIGVDLVAMNVNDLVVCGAKPIIFLDYIAVGKVRMGLLQSIMQGILAGCTEAGCALMGGETAEMPGMYRPGEYDLAGFACGLVKKTEVITGKHVKPGDVIIGLYSSGVHSNGYSLVRRVFPEREQRRLAGQLLIPTKLYVKQVLKLLKRFRANRDIKAVAHITGGGFYDNIVRVLPKGTRAVVSSRSWTIPDIFQRIACAGNVPQYEMFRTFNMGIGMVVVVAPACADRVVRAVGNDGCIIGTVERSPGRAEVLVK